MSDTPEELAFALFTEFGIINQLATARLEAHLPQGLIAPHFAVMNHLIRTGDGQTPLEMARALQVPKASLTHTLAGLENSGLIAARPHPEDRRSKQIWITPEGRRLRNETVAALTPFFQTLFERIPPGTFRSLLPPLRELRVIMDILRDQKPHPPD